MLAPNLLHPLAAESFQFTFCLDRPLQCVAIRYTLSEQAANLNDSDLALALVIASGISLSQDTWIPLLKQLFRLFSSSRVKLRAAWVIERPNHGEAALLNAELLKQHYSVHFPSLQYATAIHTFLTSNILSISERSNLVSIGHSGGGGSLIQALNYSQRDGHGIPLKTLVLLEVPLVGLEIWPFFEKILYPAVIESNARRIKSWPSVKAAMAWFETHFPWKLFHPDVLDIVAATYFIPDTERPGFFTTKTTLEQETASFVDDETNLLPYPFLLTILDTLPTHLITGTLQDLWPSGMHDLIDQNTREVRHRFASVTTMDDVGHYLPVIKPDEMATKLFLILSERLAKL